ncbi:MAG: DUF4142 domain-containing protein [Pseudomonas sp.]|uniref:DUF4142 domain-containing protein n=1 Tax=Pseudomonas sp. TaxID=306 RepID=UPI00339350BE
MNTSRKSLLSTALAVLMGTLANQALADSAADFVDEASAKGIAEIETSKMAMEKATSPDIKTFAEQMIKDHTQANQELAALATRKNLEVADDAELMSKAKAMILELRSGESFDEAYANNQVKAHEATIELFREEMQDAEDPDLKAFATSALPKLEHHLEMAKKLAAAHQKTE